MDDIKKVVTCPLGSTCTKIVGTEIHVCRWYIRMAGEDPGTGEKVDRSDCAIAFMPIMMHEMSKQQLHTTAAVDDLKNQTAEATGTNSNILMHMLQYQALPIING